MDARRCSARWIFGATALLSVLLVSVPAFTQGEVDDITESVAPSSVAPDRLVGMLGAGAIREDFFLVLTLSLEMQHDDYGLGLDIPLRFRFWDRDPETVPDDYFLNLRRQDWDEFSDYFRIIRYVYFGERDTNGPYYFRYGELDDLTIGHGTILYRYFNNQTDASRYHGGVHVKGKLDEFTAEAFIGDLVNPYVAGLRMTMRPLELLWKSGKLWEKLTVGNSLIMDTRAPFALRLDNNGAVVVDEQNRPIVQRERALLIFGFEASLPIVEADFFSLTPYMDFNVMNQVDAGLGFHLGALFHLELPALPDKFVGDFRAEFRRVAGDYAGPYFDGAYEIERYQRMVNPRVPDPGGAQSPDEGFYNSQPKLRTLCADLECSTPAPPSKNGMFLSASGGIEDFIIGGLEYIDYDGGSSDGTFRVWTEVRALQTLQLSAFYYRINVDNPGDLFGIDQKTAFLLKARVPFMINFFADARWWRVWQADRVGGYRSVDDWSLRAGFTLPL